MNGSTLQFSNNTVLLAFEFQTKGLLLFVSSNKAQGPKAFKVALVCPNFEVTYDVGFALLIQLLITHSHGQ